MGFVPVGRDRRQRGADEAGAIMIKVKIAITAAAYDAIRSTLPQDAPLWPVELKAGNS